MSCWHSVTCLPRTFNGERRVITTEEIRASVALALAEDVGTGDLTAQLIPVAAHSSARVITRETGVLCGKAWFDAAFTGIDPAIQVRWNLRDGERMQAGQLLCTLSGPSRGLLTGERTALNFLQLLSGTATTTRRYVDAVAGTECRILDTRKTVPGLRLAQKYAVLCGGGTNHRIGLFDAVLIKENHIAAAGSITAAVLAARKLGAGNLLEVEVENFAELGEALDVGVDRILLDNFSLEELERAVRTTHAHPRSQPELEASGNITLDTIAAVARTGVDFISTGALTKHVHAIDLSMRIEDAAATA
jgi:nicotinate-nucleotide pyrophosphorylase (carboxylating)